MRIFVVLILAAAFVGGWFIWSRDPLADVPTDAHGFIELPLPHGADANTVLILTARLVSDVGLSAGTVGLVMGVASLAQAGAMAGAGHLSTTVGRRRLLIVWGLVAAPIAPRGWRAHDRGGC